MKKLNLFWLIPFLALSMSLFFTACSNNDHTQEMEAVDEDAKIRTLVVKGMTKFPENASKDELKSISNDFIDSYRLLNSEEIIRYYEIRVDEVAKKYGPDNLELIQEAKELLRIKIGLNDLSVSKFKKSINQLLTEELKVVNYEFFGIEEIEEEDHPGEDVVLDEAGNRSSCYNFYAHSLVAFSEGTTGTSCINFKTAEDDHPCRWWNPNCCNDTYWFYNMNYYPGFTMSNVNCHTPEVFEHLANGLGYITQKNKDYSNGHTGFVGGYWLAQGMTYTIKNNTSAVHYNLTCNDCGQCCW